MTTKRKIILGFTLVIVVLIAVGVAGYKGISDMSHSFGYYDRFAHANVHISDMLTEVWAQAFEMERFTDTYKTEHAQAAKKHMETAAELGRKALSYLRDPQRQETMKKAVAAVEEYASLIDGIQKNLLSWQNEYDKTILPALSALQEMTNTIGAKAAQTENIPVLGEINTVWAAMMRMSYSMARFAEESSDENAALVSDAINGMKPALQSLSEDMTTETARKDFAAYRQAFELVEKSFNAQKTFALNATHSVAKSYELDSALRSAASALNTTIDEEMGRTSKATVEASANAQNLTLAISVIGFAVGLLFALYIIVGLSRILARMSAYAMAVADGDFSHDPKITEKGEIGAMVTALKRIPATLVATVKECNAAANKISCGQFRTRLDEQGFRGGFKELAHAVNTMGESYTKVIDELPVSIMSADLDRKVQFLNTMAQSISGSNAVGSFCGDQLKSSVCSNDQCYGKRSIREKKTLGGEVTVQTPKGTMHLALSSMPLYDLEGKSAGSMEIISDITQIKTQQITMAEVARHAMDISDRVAAASEELSAQVEQVSRGAEIQRERVESTASAMTEMNSTVLEVARNAGEASDQSDNTRSNAEEGAALVNKVVAAINGVNRVAMKLQDNMKDLGSRAESIGGVMNVISDIADQTNLLALNAAIEAARAGDAGRGFAVVADEVRKLAEKTMAATQEVGSSITAIQNATQMNISEVSNAVHGVTEATGLANSSGEALQGIVGLASATSSAVASIATASEEQSATSEEITRAIEEISRIVAETAEGMIQSSQAVQDLSRMAQELKRVLDDLK